MRFECLAGACLLGAFLTFAAAASATTYVVDQSHPRASDANPGSEGEPLQTISAAVKGLRSGDTVLIKAAQYRETVTIEASGAPGAPITIAAFPGDEGKVIIDGSEVLTGFKQSGRTWEAAWPYHLEGEYPPSWPDYGAYSKRAEMVFVDGRPLRQILAKGLLEPDTFCVEDSAQRIVIAPSRGFQEVRAGARQQGLTVTGNWLQIRGLTVQRVANGHRAAAFSVSGNDNLLENNRAEWNNCDGFRVGGRRVRMIGNTALYNGRCGISASVHDSLLENNVTNENSWRLNIWHSGGVKVIGGKPSNNRLVGHIARNNASYGIWLDTVGHGNRVERCLMDGNFDIGLFLEASPEGIRAVNNIISNTRNRPNTLYPEGSGAGVMIRETVGAELIHNTIVGNARVGIQIAGGLRENQSYAAEARIFNNIVASNGEAGLGFWVWGRSAEPNVLASHQSDYNLWFQPETPVALLPHGSRPAALDAWRKEFKQDLHSLAADPKFADPARQDYRLLAISPAMKRATPLYSAGEDFAGKARPHEGALDIGAYQR